uniref:Reverse transcriptase domain-containing protein n=1 Tax=Homalodisca liturata TaxID=320908 RepID=A0A1B6K909_9HEMI
MFSLISDVTKALDNKEHVHGLFLDLSKAFDVVDHTLLLRKLEYLGLRGNVFEWIHSYVTGRKQMVEIPYMDADGLLKKKLSQELIVRTGVPQGSVLGPVFFLLFVNDIAGCISDSHLYLFADDTSLVVSSKSKPQLENQIFIDGSSLFQWLEENSLCINTAKTKLVDFAIRNQLDNECLNIIIGDTEFSPSATVNYLGVVFDRNLNFSNHIEKVTGKLSSSIFLLSRLACFKSADILLLAYHGCFYPYLSYAVPIWGHESTKTQYVFRLQKRAVRIVFHLAGNQSCRSLFREKGILTFPSIYILNSLTFLIKNFGLFTSHITHTHRYQLRHNNNITLPRHSTTFFRNKTYSSCISLFNSLPQYLKNVKEPNKFKSQLKKYLIQKEYYSVQDYLLEKKD